MNKFITFRDYDANGGLCYYVLQRAFPHIIGKLLVYPKEGALAQSSIPGYYLVICFDGTLAGNLLPARANIKDEVQSVVAEMAQWYLDNRILPQESKYKKWKIINS